MCVCVCVGYSNTKPTYIHTHPKACGGLNKKYPPLTSAFEYLIPVDGVVQGGAALLEEVHGGGAGLGATALYYFLFSVFVSYEWVKHDHPASCSHSQSMPSLP